MSGQAPRQPSMANGDWLHYTADLRGTQYSPLDVTTGYRLESLNARTGAPVNSFGTNGIVDLKQGAVFGADQQIDLETGEIGVHSTPTVVKDVVIIGSSFREGATVNTTIPRPGEFRCSVPVPRCAVRRARRAV